MINLLGYLFGVALHVGFKWATWKKPTRPWLRYWSEYASLNIASAIAALVLFGLWRSGVLLSILNVGLSSWAGGPIDALEVNFWTSVFVGYAMDSVARTLWLKFGRRWRNGNGNQKP